MNRRCLIAAMTLCFAPLSGLLSANAPASLFETMNEADKVSTGLNKLSPEEQAALSSWIATQTEKAAPKETALPQFQISDVQNGRTVVLSNGESYDVSSSYKRKIKKWKSGDQIRVTPAKRGSGYKLQNVTSGQEVGAKKNAPKEEIKPTEQPNDAS